FPPTRRATISAITRSTKHGTRSRAIANPSRSGLLNTSPAPRISRSSGAASTRIQAMSERHYSADEMMTIAAARKILNRFTLFVGIGLPSAAATLARLTHAPDTVLIYESGTIGAKPNVLPLSIGDGELSETADAVVSIPEMFSYWLQGG